ncbi:hypothetical protein [Microbispora hainanensis]|uniref:hypothetical protein n=2 Tax=Microbispora TaxID=2005 RepID=UPI003247A367
MADAALKVLDLTVHADHGQFVLQDPEPYGAWVRDSPAERDLPPAGWTHEAVQLHRIAVDPYSIAVGTARSDIVIVRLRLHRAAVRADLSEAEHVVEADLDLPTGNLCVYGPADDPGDEQLIVIAGGRYRVRVSYLPADPPEQAGPYEIGEHFLYQIDLWPSRGSAGLVVLKQGPSPWAD